MLEGQAAPEGVTKNEGLGFVRFRVWWFRVQGFRVYGVWGLGA